MARLHRAPDWRAGLWAGLIAGALAEILLMGVVLLQGASLWGAARMSAAIVLGEGVLPPPETFDIGIVTASTFVHFGLSIAYGLIVAWLVHRFDWAGGLATGAAFGLAIYWINYYIFAPIAFPWFVEMRSPVTALIHVAFGLFAAAAYLWLRTSQERRLGTERRRSRRPIAIERRHLEDRRRAFA